MNAYRFAIATAIITFILLLSGGTVNPSGSALACPDWLTGGGSFFPSMVRGIQYHNTHRLVASLVGLMTVILAMWIWFAYANNRRLQFFGLTAFLLIIIQGILGGATVLLRLPLSMSVAHLAFAMLYFAVVLIICFRLRPPPPIQISSLVTVGKAGENEQVNPKVQWLVLTATFAVYFQILLGGLVRHTGSGRVCARDFLGCAGQIWPHYWPGQLQMVHRIFGLLTLLLITVSSIIVLRQNSGRIGRLARLTAVAAPIIVLLQMVVGILLVKSNVELGSAVAHTGFATILLGDLELLYLALLPEPRRMMIPIKITPRTTNTHQAIKTTE